ncbi:MAG: hypothetical protein Q8N23_09865 [Archangium sp.]|nr:hypothetical protein [Archangium sp.]MDP3569083.1 hypothetical protein [Archangium sp.]
MNALVLSLVLCASADTPILQEPTLNVVAQLELAGGARATQAPEAPFFFGLNALIGARFDPVRFGLQARGLFSNHSGLDLGGFFTVDLVRLELDSRLAIAVFTGVDVMARWVPLRASAWSTVVLGHTGLRALGLSLTVAGGAELPSGQGDGEVRLGIDFVEFITFLHLQSEASSR